MTSSTTPPSGDESPEHHIHHTIKRIEVLYATGATNPATNEIIFRCAFLLTKLAEVSSRNAAKQEALAMEAADATKENLNLQREVADLTQDIRGMTRWLKWLTIFMAIFAFITAIPTANIIFDYFAGFNHPVASPPEPNQAP